MPSQRLVIESLLWLEQRRRVGYGARATLAPLPNNGSISCLITLAVIMRKIPIRMEAEGYCLML